ncbi:hypothetical protein V6Z11_D10G231800 [Gossypium hirsutum]|uniref:Secreted protein n=1 Tax=Gossypium hirsutum TaxID=3635 RepID=A0ABM3AX63_GOSHI|nr:uncharacterized protein LOC107915710 [Gossypium hirsutum]XP_040959378.1 uncharacterized protein LOC107915710 [Gossypium hirsutum]
MGGIHFEMAYFLGFVSLISGYPQHTSCLPTHAIRTILKNPGFGQRTGRPSPCRPPVNGNGAAVHGGRKVEKAFEAGGSRCGTAVGGLRRWSGAGWVAGGI